VTDAVFGSRAGADQRAKSNRNCGPRGPGANL